MAAMNMDGMDMKGDGMKMDSGEMKGMNHDGHKGMDMKKGRAIADHRYCTLVSKGKV